MGADDDIALQRPRMDNERGVIQGSILGPFLWNVFIDDLISELESTGTGCKLPGSDLRACSSWFADDGGVFEHTCEGLQRQLDVCTAWAERNRIRFSPRKSVVMWLVKPSVLSGEYARVGNERLTLHGTQMAVVEKFCYLGIDILGNGLLTAHCSESKINRATTRLDQLRSMLHGEHGLSPRIGLQIVRAKLNTVLLYGCDILPPHPQADKVQRKALRQVVAAYDRTHNWFLYSELGESSISTLALEHFVSAAARFVASLTPVSRAVAMLIKRALEEPVHEVVTQTKLIPWQQRLRECLRKLLFGTGDQVRVLFHVPQPELKQVLKIGVKSGTAQERNSDSLVDRRVNVRAMLTLFAGNSAIGLDVCKLLLHISDKRLAFSQRDQVVFGKHYDELRVVAKLYVSLGLGFRV